MGAARRSTGSVVLQVNGVEHAVAMEPGALLLEVLREDLGLTGTKSGCGAGVCGACTVLVDGRPALACRTAATAVAGRPITTVEGLAAPGGRAGAALHPVQRAFLAEQAVQCGWCTPAMVLTAVALLAEEPHPDRQRVRERLSGVVCRCGTHPRAVAAVLRAAAPVRTSP